MQISVTKIPKSAIEIKGGIPWKDLELHRNEAVKIISNEVEIPGFRRGTVPESVLKNKVGEMHILEEMGRLALGELYPKILEEKKIFAIGAPQVSITKIGVGSPLEFTLTTAVAPEIKLPDYKRIGKETPEEIPEEVGDSEITGVIDEIRRGRAPKGKAGDLILPELNDDFAQALGPFKTMDELKEKMRENLKLEKERRAKEKRRLAILERLIKETQTELPDIMVEEEAERLLEGLKRDLLRLKINFEHYLKETGKTDVELRENYKEEGRKRATLELALDEISKKESLSPKEEEVEKEVKHLLEHHKDVPLERAREFVVHSLAKEKTIAFLEGLR